MRCNRSTIEKMSSERITVDTIPFDLTDPDAVHPTDAVYLVMDRARNPVVPPVPEPPPAPSMLVGSQEPVSAGLLDWMKQVDARIEANGRVTSGIPAGLTLFEPEPSLEPDEDLDPPFHILQVFAVVRRRQASYAAPFDSNVPRRIQYANFGRNAAVVWGDPVDPDEYVPRRVTSIVAQSVGGGEGMFNIANVDFQADVPQSLAAAVSRKFRQRKRLDWWD